MARTALESVFEFEDNAFCEYMHTESITLNSLTRLSESMIQSDNPIVRCAAGWALAEKGLMRNYFSADNGLSWEGRSKALDDSLACWSGIADMGAYRDAQPTEERRLRVLGLELRMLHAMAYVPAMRLSAAYLSGEKVAEDDLDKKWNATLKGATNIGNLVIDLPINTVRERKRRNGLANEILCGLVDMSIPGRRHIATPSSLRQDSHVQERMRSDLIVTDTQAPHQRILQQIKAGNEAVSQDLRMLIRPPELVPSGEMNSVHVLAVLSHQVAVGVEPWESSLLSAPAARMGARILKTQARFGRQE